MRLVATAKIKVYIDGDNLTMKDIEKKFAESIR